MIRNLGYQLESLARTAVVVLVRCRCDETRDDIPLLPFLVSRILPAVQILISSVSEQNPPALLSPKSVCPLTICPSRRFRSQPFPSVSRKQRYNTLDFPTENRVPTGMLLAPIGNPEPKGLYPSGHPACSCSGYPSCSCTLDTLLPEQAKRVQRFAQVTGRFLCLFFFSGGGVKHTKKPCRTLGLG